MINGNWSSDEIKEAYDNGVMEKIWPNLYWAIRDIIKENEAKSNPR